jgi:hypothetical protein
LRSVKVLLLGGPVSKALRSISWYIIASAFSSGFVGDAVANDEDKVKADSKEDAARILDVPEDEGVD